MKYPVSIACYPESFKGCVVSPTKICLQFANPECKVRPHGDESKLVKAGPNNEMHLLVSTLGTEIDCLAAGCQMPVVEDYQLQLIDAYKKYNRQHAEVYRQTYGKEFKDFLLTLRVKLNNLITEVEKL